jgi:hypothetical protein
LGVPKTVAASAPTRALVLHEIVAMKRNERTQVLLRWKERSPYTVV